MSDPIDIETTGGTAVVAVREPLLAVAVPQEAAPSVPPMTAAQHRVVEVNEALLPAFQKAGNLVLAKDEIERLMARFDDDKVSARPHDGLLYIEHIHIARRMNEVFGPMQWTMIRRREWCEANRVYAEWVMVVRGVYAGESVGAMDYHPSNPKMNYSDALEGTRGEAIRRIAGKYLSCGDQVWEKSYCEEWKERQRAPRAPRAPEATAPRAAAPPQAPKPMTRAEQRPMESAEDKAKAAKKKEKQLATWLETCKAEFLKRIEPSPFLWAWWKLAVDEGWILSVETLKDAPATKIFPGATADKTWAQIKTNLAERYAELSGKAQEIAEQTDRDSAEAIKAEFKDAYDSPLNGPAKAPEPAAEFPAPTAEKPAAPAAAPRRDPDAGQVGEWWRDVKMPFGRDKGVRLEDLDKNVLFGWWANFEVTDSFEGRDGKKVQKKPEQMKADAELRKALDAAGEHYRFEKKD